MTVVLVAVIAGLAVALGAVLAAAAARRPRVARTAATPVPPEGVTRRILFPFIAAALSGRALDAALRLARAEDATLLPVILAQVPRRLPLDAALPRQSGMAIATQEAIEQRAAAFGVPIDARVERGRTARHALGQAIANERFDRIVIAAAAVGAPGFHPDDVAWLLATAPGEIVVLRPAHADALLQRPAERAEVVGDDRHTVAMGAA
jgi:hypothetical protein